MKFYVWDSFTELLYENFWDLITKDNVILALSKAWEYKVAKIARIRYRYMWE
jgi:hypothetical protein